MSRLLVFTVASLPEGDLSPFEVVCSPEDADLGAIDEDIVVSGPVTISGTAQRMGGEVLFDLHASATATLLCRRCLEPAVADLDSEFKILYRPATQRRDDEEDTDEIGLAYYDAGIIDVREDVRRYLLLEVPIWLLCDEDCRGLCHHCGANLNVTTCECQAEPDSGDRETDLSRQLARLMG